MGHVVSTKADLRRLTISTDDDDSLFLGDFEYPKKSDNITSDQTNESADQTSREECPICTEEILLRDLAKLDPCNHEFHQQCINQWLEDHNTCPNCRADVSQIVYGYKMCMRKHLNREFIDTDDFADDDDDDDDDDELADEVENLIFSRSDENEVDTHSIASSTIILGNDDSCDRDLSEWVSSDHLIDPNTGKPELEVDITDDRSIRLTFDFTCPEITFNSDRWWRLTCEDEIIAEVSPTSRLMLRGDYVRHLKNYQADVDGQIIPLINNREIADLYDESPDKSQWTELQFYRHERFSQFLRYLSDPVSFSFM